MVLGAAQFLMVLDQAVMNVAISQLVEDFDTTVTTIQMVIALYALVMAGLMLTGGKLGDLWGRRRAFSIGLVIYGAGSALTAASWSVPSLMLGWSILEGIGAALVLPALVALVAGNYKGADRAIAYGALGGVAGAGIAVGPILGGWMTTDFTWRLVFVGEVVVAIGILLGTRMIREPEREQGAPGLDWVGSVLSASGLALIVFGVLQASNWGWLAPRASPIEPFGFSLTPFVIAAGALVLGGFVSWERRREERGLPPLVHLGMLRIRALRGGVAMLLAQNLILMGIFFTIPLYLQIVQGLDVLETGVQMLPASAGLFVAALAGSIHLLAWRKRRTRRAGHPDAAGRMSASATCRRSRPAQCRTAASLSTNRRGGSRWRGRRPARRVACACPVSRSRAPQPRRPWRAVSPRCRRRLPPHGSAHARRRAATRSRARPPMRWRS